MIKVSVVVTTYNRREKLQRALEGVFKQTIHELEIIVVDNASTDGTQAMVKAMTDPRLRYICHDLNKGGPAARNSGIQASCAPYIALLDDDDVWHAQKLEKQLAKFQECGLDVGLVYVGSEIYDEQTSSVRTVNRPQYRGNVYERLLLSTIIGSVSSVLVKRECFNHVGLFDEELKSCQDWDMWLRIAEFYQFDYVNETLARINMHGDQISTNYAALIPGRSRMVQKHRHRFEQYPHMYVVHLKRLGKLHILNGTWLMSVEWFIKAMKVSPLEFFKILAWLILELPFVKWSSRNASFKKFVVKKEES